MYFIKYLISLILIIKCICANITNHNYEPQYRIVNGVVQDPKLKYPIVSLGIMDILYRRSHICGGSIVRNDKILTAAHCVMKKPYGTTYIIIAGTSDIGPDVTTASVYIVSSILTHAKYNQNSNGHENDIALLYLKRKLPDNILRESQLPLKQAEIASDTQCYILGWGKINTDAGSSTRNLMRANIKVYPMANCYPAIYSFFKGFSTDGMICAGAYSGADICDGDSGGPLICNNILTGISSHGWGCGIKPGVYTKISKYYNWIQTDGRVNTNISSNILLEINIVICIVIVSNLM